MEQDRSIPIRYKYISKHAEFKSRAPASASEYFIGIAYFKEECIR